MGCKKTCVYVRVWKAEAGKAISVVLMLWKSALNSIVKHQQSCIIDVK